MPDLPELISHIQSLQHPDRNTDEQIVLALGGEIREMSGGRKRAFFDYTDPDEGIPIPFYTRTAESRGVVVARLQDIVG